MGRQMNRQTEVVLTKLSFCTILTWLHSSYHPKTSLADPTNFWHSWTGLNIPTPKADHTLRSFFSLLTISIKLI